MSTADTSDLGPDTPRPPGPEGTARDLTGRAVGDFRIERLLGRGGMGEVYLARQVSLDRPIALKVLKPEMLANPTYRARLQKEATSAAKLNHPNIVHVYSAGEADGLLHIAMEYVPGTNLKEFLVRRGIPELPLAYSIMRQATQAVAAAGEVGLVHRDIKPENLLLTRKGQVKVADFGLCRSAEGPGQVELTQEGVTLGTPMYMSPEQVQGRELDARSDLYSLGVTFYHMLAGVPPFRADSALALALKHVREAPVSLAVHRPDLPPELVAAIMRLLEKDPRKRYASAAELLRELTRQKDAILAASPTEPMADAAPRDTEPVPLSAPAGRPPRPPGRGLGERLRGYRPRRRDLVLSLLAAAVAGALLGLRGRAPDLLSERFARPQGPPGAWIARWQDVPARPSAEAQYRFAQLQAGEPQRVAAWLAVPGRFPQASAREWAARAYTQLARSLFRRGDADRLEALAAELGADAGLAGVARAGAAALRGEADRVQAAFAGMLFERQDAGLNELSYEVIARARRGVGPESPQAAPLRRLEEQVVDALGLPPALRVGAAPASSRAGRFGRASAAPGRSLAWPS
jgi:serine/threonine-protein kinase